jgi:hypothetical protein
MCYKIPLLTLFSVHHILFDMQLEQIAISETVASAAILSTSLAICLQKTILMTSRVMTIIEFETTESSSVIQLTAL